MSNTLALLPKVNGMVLTNPTKTGARRVQLISKRDFVAARKNEGKTTSEATRLFEAYRIQTTDELNQQIGQAFARGDLRADRIGANGEGEVTTIGMVRRTRTQRDRAAQAKQLYLNSLPPSVREQIEIAEKAALGAIKQQEGDTHEAEVREVPQAANNGSETAEQGRPAQTA